MTAAPALAEPMSAAEFEQRFQALQNATVLQCIDPARRGALEPDRRLDACIAAVNDVEDKVNALHPQGSERGVYLALDTYIQLAFAKEIQAIDGGDATRLCRTVDALRGISNQIDTALYDPAVAANIRDLTGQVDQLNAACGN